MPGRGPRRLLVRGVVVARSLPIARLAVGADGLPERRGDGGRRSVGPSLVQDSTGNFLAALWAERIEEKLGIEVRVHDFAGPG